METLDLYSEFQEVIKRLNDSEIPYALCGGIAVAVHGFPRATVDIDLLVQPTQIPLVKDAVKDLGYVIDSEISGLAGGKVTITRLTKIFAAGDFMCLDLLHAESTFEPIWAMREKLITAFGELWVIPPTGLIQMKRMRFSNQDKADIERLEQRINES